MFQSIFSKILFLLQNKTTITQSSEPTMTTKETKKESQFSDEFEYCLSEILHHEGGFVNHPRDTGGITNLGVTKRVYEAWVGHSVTEQDMRNLTKADVAPLYHKNYWLAVQANNMPLPVALCVFDFAVNAGPARAARFLQSVIGAAPDGKIGPKSLQALKTATDKSMSNVVKQYQADRQKYYESLSNYDVFGKGWTRRVNEITEKALSNIK